MRAILIEDRPDRQKLFLSDIDNYMGIQGQKSIVLTCILKNKEELQDTENLWSKLKSIWK